MINVQDIAGVSEEKKSREPATSIWNRDISLSPVFPDVKKAAFYHQLYNLANSGVDFKTALELTKEQFGKKPAAAVVDDILSELVGGKSLSEAFKATGKFTAYEYFSLKIGEESGRMVQVLQTLGKYYTQKVEQRRQLINALSYPIVIVTSSFGAVAFMMFFIIPMFQEVFLRFGSELPALTKFIISFSAFLKSNIGYFLLILAVMVGGFYFIRNYPRVVGLLERFFLRVPYIGQIYREVHLARCTSSLALLIQANVPLVLALQYVGQMVTMQTLKSALREIENKIVQGRSLHEAFAQFSLF